jgi:hypothetical protein
MNLFAGSYEVLVTDSNGCENSTAYKIEEPLPLSADIITINDSIGLCKGMAVGNGLGGVAPYSYLWNDSLMQTGDTAFGLCIDEYCLTVVDSNNCQFDTCGIQILIGKSEVKAQSPDVTLYPNPSFGAFTVPLEGRSGSLPYFRITDFMGKVVSQGRFEQEQQRFDLSHQGEGVYTITIFSDGYRAIRRVVVL